MNSIQETQLERYWIEQIGEDINISSQFDPLGISIRKLSSNWKKFLDETSDDPSGYYLSSLDDLTNQFLTWYSEVKSIKTRGSDRTNVEIYIANKIFEEKRKHESILDDKVRLRYIAIWIDREFRGLAHESSTRSFKKALPAIESALTDIVNNAGISVPPELIAKSVQEIKDYINKANPEIVDRNFLMLRESFVRILLPNHAVEILGELDESFPLLLASSNSTQEVA